MTPDPNAPSWGRNQEIPDCLRSTMRPEDVQAEAQKILAEAIRDMREAEKRIREGPRTCQVCGAVYCGPDHKSYPSRCPACVTAAMRVVPRKGFRTLGRGRPGGPDGTWTRCGAGRSARPAQGERKSERMAIDKESVYDEEISPLVQQIIEICKRESIPFVMDFGLREGDEETEEVWVLRGETECAVVALGARRGEDE